MATISEALAIAVQHQQAGRLQAAEEIYRQILAADPKHADAWHLSGVIASQTGRPQAAIEYIGRAIALNGTVAAYYNDVGNALRDLGKLVKAAACYRCALELNPDYAVGHSNLGVVLRDQGNLDEAIVCYRRALELTPDFAVAHFNLGNVLTRQGNLDEAIASYSRAIELKPDYAEAHYNLGNALRDQWNLDDAIACYHRVLDLKPDYAEAHSNLGSALQKQGKPDEAAACCRRALELKPDYAEARNNLGNALKDQGMLNEAMACYRRAVELKPDYAVAHTNLGASLAEIADFQGAEDSFRTALRHDARSAAACFELAVLLGNKLPERDLRAIDRLLDNSELPPRHQLLLHFGLARVLDARGEYIDAAEHADRANAMQLHQWRERGLEYDPQAHEHLVTRMIEVCGMDFFNRIARFDLEGVGPDSDIPIFVVGLPRSGTTLVEQILASHSQVYAAGETTLARDTFAAFGGQGRDSVAALGELDRKTALQLASSHLRGLRALHGAASRIVDKTPENYLLLGLVAALFPRARFIHCRRDLRDVAVSCWMTRFRDVRWANDPQHIASRFREYQRIMEHWRNVLPSRIFEMDYEATVADLEGTARRLVAWCGLDWEAACLEFHQSRRPVRTASVVQVRRPVYGTSVGRWKHYEQALASLLSGLPGS